MEVSFSAASQPFGAGDNLDQFSGDIGLTGAVVAECQPVDHLAGVARCIVHRGHSRALLAGRVFQQRSIELYREIVRQQFSEDFLLARLEFVDRAADRLYRAFRAGRRGWRGERDQLLHGDDLRHRRAETVEDDPADVELAGLVERENAPGDVARLVERYATAPDIGQAVMDQPGVIAAQTIAPLAANRQQLDGFASVVEIADAAPRLAQNRGVEAAGETAVGT